MAKIAVRRDAFEAGQFPPVCCKTGAHTDNYVRWTFGKLIGVLPITKKAIGRAAIMRRFTVGVTLAGVVFAIVTYASDKTLSPFVVIFAALAVLSALAAWLISPGARAQDNVVVLSRVHRTFTEAIRNIPAPAPEQS